MMTPSTVFTITRRRCESVEQGSITKQIRMELREKTFNSWAAQDYQGIGVSIQSAPEAQRLGLQQAKHVLL